MTNARFLASFLLVLLASFSVLGQFQPPSFTDSKTKIFPVSELREGMHGTAKTVFRGDKPEEFNVEILGVLPNWIGPKQDVIIGRLSGANAERTFVFAGMSGSPVYIDGKLVGAISYSFPFAKEPICGITPFEQMVSSVESVWTAKSPSQPKAFAYADLLSNTLQSDLSGNKISGGLLASGFSTESKLMAVAGQTMQQIATPVSVSGLSQKTLDLFASQFAAAGFMPIAASGGSSTVAPMKTATSETLLGGDSVIVHLSRGDVTLAAAGTVTLRDGDKIYAFGHPFFGLGSTNMLMSESHVVTVIPNANNSFKLAVPDAPVGAMTQDRATGIFGMLGVTPRMLPIKINLKTSRGLEREINFETAIDEILTPLILTVGVNSTLTANERNIGDSTFELSGEIQIRGEESIKLNRRFVGAQAAMFASSAAAVPVGALLRAGFEGLDITGITLNITANDGSKTAALDRLATDRVRAKAGETIELTAFERTEAGKIIVQKIPVIIPKNALPGTVMITVGDGNAVQQNTAITQFIPKTAAELISTINRLKRSDRLYYTITRTSSGAIIGASEMPNLPPSVLATINNDRTAGGTKPTVNTIIADAELPAGDYILTGSQSLTVEIVR